MIIFFIEQGSRLRKDSDKSLAEISYLKNIGEDLIQLGIITYKLCSELVQWSRVY